MTNSGTVRTFQPPVWNIGNVSGVASSSRRPHAVIVLNAFQTTPPWVRTVSLGRPVDPPVCRNRCGSASAMSTGSKSAASGSASAQAVASGSASRQSAAASPSPSASVPPRTRTGPSNALSARQSAARSVKGASTTSSSGATSSSSSPSSGGARRWFSGARTPPVFPVPK